MHNYAVVTKRISYAPNSALIETARSTPGLMHEDVIYAIFVRIKSIILPKTWHNNISVSEIFPLKSTVNCNVCVQGWDKHSYGYHGDDGHSFCSSGTGQPYGPTFTTGDVIGCGVNLIDNTCFYTKNGHHLGIAFRGLPVRYFYYSKAILSDIRTFITAGFPISFQPNLYPTVGLQTPGEVVDANFGQQPFVFDIEDMLRELRARTRIAIDEFPLPDEQGQWQQVLHRYLSPSI